MKKQSQLLTCSVGSEASVWLPKSQTRWPTPNAMDGDRPYETTKQWQKRRERKKMENPKLGDLQKPLEIAVLLESPIQKLTPSPVKSITGTFPIRSALVRSPMLQKMKCLSDAAFSRLSLLEVSHVSHTVAPENALRVWMNATYGMNAGGCLANFDPATRSLKTSRGCLLRNLDGSSDASSETWPRSGILVSGKVFALPMLMRPIEGSASGCSVEAKSARPTSMSKDYKGSRSVEAQKRSRRNPQTNSLCDAVESKQWMTPQAQDCKQNGMRLNSKAIMLIQQVLSGQPLTASGLPDPTNRNGSGNRKELQEHWPTPASHNETGGVVGLAGGAGNRKKLYTLLGEEDGKKMGCQKLNPHWVFCLMGYPPLWAELGRRWVKPGTTRVNKKTARQAKAKCSTESGS